MGVASYAAPTFMHDPGPPNPYAPPRTDVVAPYVPAPGAHDRPDIAMALARLHAHVGDPRSVEADRQASGARVRPIGWVLLALGPCIAVGMMFLNDLAVAGAAFGFILFFIGVLIVGLDLSLTSRSTPAPPEKALKSFLRAIAMARDGYAWECLCPTAREQTVASPRLDPVQTTPGQFRLFGKAELKAYLTSFARGGGSVVRRLTFKDVQVGVREGEVVRVQAELHFQSWPRWVSITTMVGLIVFRPLVIIGAVAYFVTRKRRVVRVLKTMLCAQNGVWYVYDGDVLEGAVG